MFSTNKVVSSTGDGSLKESATVYHVMVVLQHIQTTNHNMAEFNHTLTNSATGVFTNMLL